MPTDFADPSRDSEAVFRELTGLRSFAGSPREFWPAYVVGLAGLSGATSVVVLLREGSDGAPWKTVGEWSGPVGSPRFLVSFSSQLQQVAGEAAAAGGCLSPLDQAKAQDGVPYMLGVRLPLLRAEETCVAALLLPETGPDLARDVLRRVQLAADVPASYQQSQIARQARNDVEKFATALDLLAQVNAEKRFLAAALALCNGVATRFRCDRASLGWLQGGYIKLRAISRTEKFDRQMAAAKALEMAMEEALDQDEEVAWPAPPDSTVVARDHERFVKDQQPGHVCSLPLRADQKPLAVLTCERQNQPFSLLELQQLRLCCDQAAPRLVDLQRQDRWFGARWTSAAREQSAKLLGPEHTWAKVLALTITLVLAVVCFVRVPYRIEGNFLLRSEDVTYLTAPFEGYLKEVHVRPGDVVPAGASLVSLDTSELELQAVSAEADLARFTRESERARAAQKLAEMRIAEASAQQAQATLDIIRYRLERAQLKAPFNGVVVEGDLRERLAAPVKQGDPLLKVARLDTLYAEAEINERDVHEILGKARGEIAFVSQPKLKYPITIETVEPAAFPKQDGNIFLVRCRLEGSPQPWWRPGMSGLCKLSVERRTLLWIFTHRTVDFLRMKLWW